MESVERPRTELLAQKLAASIAQQAAEHGGPVMERVPEPTGDVLRAKERAVKATRKEKETKKKKKTWGGKIMEKPRKSQLKRVGSKASKYLGGR